MQETATSVLVVDDERFFREAIQEALAADALECRSAATAADAMREAEDPAVGVVVLDIQLPDQSGLEVLRRLRELRPELRVVVLSAHTDQEFVLEALRLGACDYLAKPLHEEELRLSVRRALESFGVAARSEALRRRVQRVASEAQGLVAAAHAGDAAALAAQAAEAAARLLNASKTSLMRLDQSGRRLEVVAATGRKGAPDSLDAVELGEGVAGWAVARGETLCVADVSADARFARRSVRDRYATPSFVVVPVGRAVRCWGALCATDRSGGEPFGEEDVALLGVLAQLLVPLLEPAGPGAVPLASGAPQAGEPSELARRVCETITAEVDPARILAQALQAVAEELPAAPVSIHLAEVGGGRLLREVQWEGDAASDRAELPRERGLTGTVLETGHPVAAAHPEQDPRFAPEVDTPEDGRELPLLIVPLRFRGKSLGVARAFLAPGAIPEPRTAEVLGAALSAAVRNALLYRSLLASIEEVARIRREGQARA